MLRESVFQSLQYSNDFLYFTADVINMALPVKGFINYYAKKIKFFNIVNKFIVKFYLGESYFFAWSVESHTFCFLYIQREFC